MISILLLSILITINVYCAPLNDNKLNLVESFLTKSQIKCVEFFVCWNKHDSVKFQKIISKLYIRSLFIQTDKTGFLKMDDENYNKIGVILDLSCKNSNDILTRYSKNGKFSAKYKWLMVSLVPLEDIVQFYLPQDFKLRLDSDVTIAIEKSKIHEIYKPHLNSNITISEITNNSGKSFYEKRRNLTGVTMRSATVIKNYFAGTLEDYMNDPRFRELDNFSKVFNQVFLVLQNMHGFLNDLTVTDVWFGNTTNGIDGGVAKLLHEDKIDISNTGGIFRIPRVDVIDFLTPVYKFRACFLFRNPGVHDFFSYAILKPFSSTTWYVTIILSAMICVFIKFAYWTKVRYQDFPTRYSWASSVIITVAVFSQQGSPLFPSNTGGRIIFLNLLIFSVMLYNYYTSSLVSSLLNTAPPVLKTIAELDKSSLEVGIENQPYTITYIKLSEDPSIKHINRTKIYANNHLNFYTPNEGIRKVLQGGFAYHTEPPAAYPIIARTFEQQAICDLAEIDFVPSGAMSLMAQKNSQYRKLFQISLGMIIERGIMKRETLIWVAEKPKCMSNARVISAGNDQVFAAFLILFVGVLVALILLGCEVIWFKYVVERRVFPFKI